MQALRNNRRSTRPARSPAWVLAAAVALLAVWAFLALGLGRQSLWFDEAWSAYGAAQPTLAAAANADATNPPLYYAALHVHARLFGTSEWSLRLFSAWCGLLACALAARLAMRLTARHGRASAQRAGLFAVLALGTLPLFAWAAHEARMYTLIAVFTLAGALGLERAVAGLHGRRVPRWAWVLSAAGPLGVLYAHNTGPVAFVWLNGAFVLACGLAIARGQRRPALRTAAVWVSIQAGVFALWVPYLARFLAVAGANDAVTSAPPLTPGFAFTLMQSLWLVPWERLVRPLSEDPFAGAAGLFAAATLIMVAWGAWRSTAVRWPALHALMLSAGVVAALVILQNEMHSRYLVFAAPFAAVAIAAAVALAVSRAHGAWRIAAAGILLAGGVLGQIAAEDPRFFHDDARALAAYYAQTLGPGDHVLAWSYADRYDLAYYWPRAGVQAGRITLPEGAGYAAVAPRIPTAGVLARSVWFTQRADYRGMLGCLLGGGRAQPHRSLTVNGLFTELYEAASPAPALPGFIPLGESGRVLLLDGAPVVRIDAVGQPGPAPADRGLCVPVRLTLLAALGDDVRVALLVRDARGRVVVQTDAIAADDAQRTGRALPAGAVVEAYPLVYLPVGAPAGRYTVTVRVYAETRAPHGLMPAADPAFGLETTVGVWNAVPGAWEAVEPAGLESAALSTDAIAWESDDLGWASGGSYEVRVRWFRADAGPALPALTVQDAAGAWSVALAAPPGTAWAGSRWAEVAYTVRVPADAPDGTAQVIGDGRVLAQIPVVALPFVAEAPPMTALAEPLRIDGVGTLLGVQLPDRIRTGTPFTVVLVWQASETPGEAADGDLIAFVQMLDSSNRVVEQSDQPPTTANASGGGGVRPVRGWRPGEIVADVHVLTLSTSPPEDALPLRLIAGLYNRATMLRLGEREFPAEVTQDAPGTYRFSNAISRVCAVGQC